MLPPCPADTRGFHVSRAVNFREIGQFLPHPLYAAMGWVCVVNPAANTDTRVLALLREAHDAARARTLRRAGREE